MQTITGFDEKLATIFVKLFTGTGDLRSNLLSAKCWLRSLVVKACRSCRDMGKSGLAGQQCPLLAQSGHLNTRYQYPLSGVKRTVVGDAAMSAFDPKPTFTTPSRTPEFAGTIACPRGKR